MEDNFSKIHEKCKAEVNNNVPLPDVTFSTFLMSLHTSALTYLGLIPHPDSGEKKVNLCLAKHTIDTITMLEEKTKNNLTEDEAELLGNIIYELRMLYVKKVYEINP